MELNFPFFDQNFLTLRLPKLKFLQLTIIGEEEFSNDNLYVFSGPNFSGVVMKILHKFLANYSDKYMKN